MILAETVQFTPEQERALMAAVLIALVGLVLFVVGFLLSVVAGIRSGADPTRTPSRVYWATWIVIELALAVAAVHSGELVWIGTVGTMLVLTGGAEAFGRAFRSDPVSRDRSSPEGSRPANPGRGAPGSRP